jgi:hypothetical protein
MWELRLTPLLHKDVVESTVCPHQKAVSTFLAGPGSAPASGSERGASLRGMGPSGAEPAPEGGPHGFESKRLARREQRGIISNGVNLSAEFNATTGLTLQIADFISLSGFFSLLSLFG